MNWIYTPTQTQTGGEGGGGVYDSRRSTTGYVVFAAGGPIARQSKLQTTVAASIMEAEYMAAFSAIQECVWVKG